MLWTGCGSSNKTIEVTKVQIKIQRDKIEIPEEWLHHETVTVPAVEMQSGVGQYVNELYHSEDQCSRKLDNIREFIKEYNGKVEE